MENKHSLNRTQTPPIGNHYKLKLSNPEHIKLDNNINTYIFNKSSEEFVKIDIVFDGGAAMQSKSLAAATSINLLTDGTSHMTSAEIANKIDFHGAYFDKSITKDKASISVYSINKHLTKILPLLTDIITQPIFPENEMANYLHRKKHQFLLNNQKIKYTATAEFNKLVFGEQSLYGKIAVLSDYDKLTRDDLLSHFNNFLQLSNAYIIVSGKITTDVIALINKHIGSIVLNKSKSSTLKKSYTGIISDKDKYIKKNGSLQSAIRIGRPIINKQHKDFDSLIVLNTIFGGFFGSRLMSNLREDKGFTYGINSFIVSYKHGTYFNIATEVNAQNTQAAIDEISFELDRIKNIEVSKKELELVKNYIYGTYLRSFDGSLALADRFRSAMDLGLDLNFYAKSLSNMMEQTPKQIMETANNYFNFDDMIKLVVGNMENK